LNASSFALDGVVNPESFRTNWSDEARISSFVAGGEKLCRVLMARHMKPINCGPISAQGCGEARSADENGFPLSPSFRIPWKIIGVLATTFAMTVARLNEWRINFKSHAATQTTPANALAHSRLSTISYQLST
jgi:hypothetical protein